MKTRHFLFAIPLGIYSLGVCAEQNDQLDLEKITIKVIDVHTHVGGVELDVFSIRKVCLDDQAYLLTISLKGGTSISAAFKDGKPEKCTFPPDGRPILVK